MSRSLHVYANTGTLSPSVIVELKTDGSLTLEEVKRQAYIALGHEETSFDVEQVALYSFDISQNLTVAPTRVTKADEITPDLHCVVTLKGEVVLLSKSTQDETIVDGPANFTEAEDLINKLEAKPLPEWTLAEKNSYKAAIAIIKKIKNELRANVIQQELDRIEREQKTPSKKQSKILQEGWLRKAIKRHVLTSYLWQRRFFILEENGTRSALTYSKTPGKAQRVLYIREIEKVEVKDNRPGKPFKFLVTVTHGRRIFLQAYSTEEGKKWVQGLNDLREKCSLSFDDLYRPSLPTLMPLNADKQGMSRQSFSFPITPKAGAAQSKTTALQAFTPMKESTEADSVAPVAPGLNAGTPSTLDDVQETEEPVKSLTENDSSPPHVSDMEGNMEGNITPSDSPPPQQPPSEAPPAPLSVPETPPPDTLRAPSSPGVVVSPVPVPKALDTSEASTTMKEAVFPSTPISKAPSDSITLNEDELPPFTSQFSSLPEDFDGLTDRARSIAEDEEWQEMPIPDEPQTPVRIMDDYYKIADDFVLGSGLTSTVKLCTKINPLPGQSTEFAVKIINKLNANLDESLFQEEIKLLRKVRHKNIISLEDVFENEEYIFIVTELAYGGELFDKILEEQRLEERDARSLMFKIVDAVAYLHSWGIAHRDLKPENILFSTDKPNAEPKLMDFGFAQDLMNDYNALQAVNSLGTRGYAAPEVFSGDVYDEKCDVWSLGVITYILLSGRPPFIPYDEDDDRPFWTYVNDMANEPEEELEFPPDLWRSVSDAAQHFCSVCLQVNPKKRARSRELLQHPWLKALHPEQKKKAAFTRTFDKHDFKLAQKMMTVSAISEHNPKGSPKSSPKSRRGVHVRSNSVEFTKVKIPAKP